MLGIATALALGLTLAPPLRADTSILIQMTEIQIVKEDDPLSNDEPYLINIGFKAQIAVGEDGKPSLVPGSFSVTPVGRAAHNNCGRKGDNWANRGGKYAVDTQLFGTVIPSDEPGWIAGVISVLFEEDAYSDSTANELRNRLRDEVSEAMTALSFESVDTSGLTRAVASKIVRDLQRAGSRLNIAGLFRNLASAMDPDDFGGVNMVLAITMPQNGLMMFAGSPPENVGAVPTLTMVPQGEKTSFSLDFPKEIPGSVLWNARYRGKCVVKGVVYRGN